MSISVHSAASSNSCEVSGFSSTSATQAETAGAFASFELDKKKPEQFGWKIYNVKDAAENEGSRSHANTERIVLEFMKSCKDLTSYVAQMHGATLDKYTTHYSLCDSECALFECSMH